MLSDSFGYRQLTILSALALTGLALVACAPQYPPPEQIGSSSPRISYKYHTDQDLVQTNQTAANFCSQYQSVARTMTFANDPDGSKSVSYECVRPAPQYMPQTVAQPAPAPYYNPNMAYSYRSEQELAEATRNAQVYCMNNGAQQVSSTISTNMDGSRSARFFCSPH
ncbi:hypothetical protein [Magnetospirillum moscoviense]|uniref:Secreted protein n=1 Tax=Magnetospirillum moscoviense TaxID=1437059 RepID=A0A178MRG7_9PROT|nr:hypothetical protein [Magnetospirillum moscoviense]OAN51533.1 hypothetical protein A6A05_01335 [Magnetospirillum moscoviense]